MARINLVKTSPPPTNYLNVNSRPKIVLLPDLCRWKSVISFNCSHPVVLYYLNNHKIPVKAQHKGNIKKGTFEKTQQ